MKRLRVIYFVDGSKPTEEDKAAIAAIDGRVITRNARFVGDELEPCDAVAGKIPEAYARAFPSVEVAISANMQEDESKKDLLKEVQESPATAKTGRKPRGAAWQKKGADK